MNDKVIEKIIRQIAEENISFGESKVTFIWHDGRIVKYTIETSEQHNLQQPVKAAVRKTPVQVQKEQEVA